MTRFVKSFFLFCGIVSALAAFPVFGQENKDGITINKRPFKDFGEFVKQKLDNKEVDLDKPFLVELEGILTKDGRFDTKNTRFIRSEGDAEMIKVAKQAISAISDSGWFAYLQKSGVEKINLILAQDDKTVSSIIKSEMADENKAKTIASGLNAIIQIGKTKIKDGEDEKLLLNGANVASKEKQFIINFAMPKSAAQEMINRRLKELERSRAEQ